MTVTILGSDLVPDRDYCTWEASVSGGTAPYTYQWTRNGSPVGTSSAYSGYTGEDDDSFTLNVDVEDANHNLDGDQILVNVDHYLGECSL